MPVIDRYLSSDDIVVDLDVADKEQALEAAALMAERRHHIDHVSVFRSLWRREQTGSTGLGHGFAVPHARIAGISEPIVLLMRTKRPILYGAPDRKPVSVLLAILVPEQANQEHLQILAEASAKFADENFRQRLAAAGDPAAIHHLLCE